MTLNIPHGRRETGTEKQVEEKETQEKQEPATGAEAQAGDVRGSGAREATRPEAAPAAAPARSAEPARSAGPARPVEPPRPARPVQPVEAPKSAGSAGSAGSVADDGLSERMDHAVGGFVDDPRAAVREAEAVLDEAGRRFTRMLEQMRADAHGKGEPDTEELRLALTRYRDMTRKLLDLVAA